MSNQKTINNADQTELEALFNSSAPLDAGIIDDKQASALDAIDLSGLDDTWVIRDAELDDLGSDLSTEISKREDLLNGAYPFSIYKSGLKLKKKSVNLFYIFCLILSHSPLKAPRGAEAVNQHMARLFERVTLKIIQTSLGKFSKAYHFGFPRDDGTGIIEAMEKIKSALNLSHEWDVNLIDYVKEKASRQKDLGIDQIIYVKRPDKRNHSHLFLLGQCACGDDYKSKYHDISIEKLKRYFRPFTNVPPVKMMSIPFILSDNDFQAVSDSAGWLFDRISLSTLYMEYEEIRQEYDAKLIELISKSTPYGEKFINSNYFESIK